MGLCITTRDHTPDVNWSYGGFMAFRKLLAAEDGINLDRMRGFAGSWDDPEEPADAIAWDTVDSTLKPLLDHSDCDGELTPAECRAVVPRLKEIHRDWAAQGIGDLDKRWEAERLATLIEVLVHCSATESNAIFC